MDGTKNFIQRDGDFAVQIGLADGGEVVCGAVYQPVREVLYRAVRGHGAWTKTAPTNRRRKCKFHRERSPAEMVLASSRSHRSPRMERVVDSFGFKYETRRGSVGVKIGLIAEQEADLYLHLSPGTKQWDTCAPEIVLTEAGGRLTDLFGKPLRYNAPRIDNRNGVVATNSAAHEIGDRQPQAAVARVWPDAGLNRSSPAERAATALIDCLTPLPTRIQSASRRRTPKLAVLAKSYTDS